MHLRNVCLCAALILVLATVGTAAPPLSRVGDERVSSSPANLVSSPTPYRPAGRQNYVLFVEDPGDPGFGPAVKPDTVWDLVLDQVLGAGNYGWFGPTTAQDENGPPAAQMSNYCMVIWNTYDFWWSGPAALTGTDQAEIAAYLNAGGKVWLIGHDVVWSGVPLPWLLTWFHLAGVIEDYVSGVPSLNVHGLAEINCISLSISSDFQANDFYPDALTPDAVAHPVLEDVGNAQDVGIFYPGTDFMSSFWGVDCRTPVPWADWVNMVSGMLDGFGCLVGVEEESAVTEPPSFGLQARPNPSSHHAVISYALPASHQASLRIYDLSGRLIRTLVNGVAGPGNYQVTWDGKDSRGGSVESGVYLYRLESSGQASTQKLVVLR